MPQLRWLIALSGLLLSACSADLLHRLPEAEAAQILAVLQQHGIEASKELDMAEENLWRIRVPSSSTGRAFSILAEYKLPQQGDRRLKDVFGGNKLVMTPTEEQALFLEALQGEIAHTLEAIDGVIDARVHLVQPRESLSGRPLSEAKASVVLEYQPSAQGLEPIQNIEIQRVVANSVSGLLPENVAVVQKPASIAAPGSNLAGDVNLVSVGPLVIEESALASLKGIITVTVLLLAGLGFGLFWQGRIIEQLRHELKMERTELAVIDGGLSQEPGVGSSDEVAAV